jgi:DNA-binding transcriptional regulator YiaG
VPEEKKKLPMIIRQIRSWRFRNRLSQRAAVEVMRERGGFKVSESTLKAWEQGRNEPGDLAVQTLRAFLKAHKRIENPPVYKPGPKPRRK